MLLGNGISIDQHSESKRIKAHLPIYLAAILQSLFVDANVVCNHYTEEFGPIEQSSVDDVVPPTCGARSHDLATCARNVKAF